MHGLHFSVWTFQPEIFSSLIGLTGHIFSHFNNWAAYGPYSQLLHKVNLTARGFLLRDALMAHILVCEFSPSVCKEQCIARKEKQRTLILENNFSLLEEPLIAI